MPQKSPQDLPETDIIRAVREVVNNNADLLPVGLSISADDVLTLATKDPDNNLTLDLKGHFKPIGADPGETVDPATEQTAGKIRIATDSEAAQGTDDTTALSPRKGLALVVAELNDRGLTGGGNGGGTPDIDQVLTEGNSSAQSLIVGKVYSTNPSSAGANEAVLPAVWNTATHEFEKITAALLANLLAPFLPSVTVTPVVPLVVAVASYVSSTGVLTMTSGGGGSSPVEYRIPNLFDWQLDSHFTIPDNLRDGNTELTIECRADARTASVKFRPTLPTATAWLGDVSMTSDVNTHAAIVFTEGTNCPNGVNLSITRSDGVAQSGTSYGVNWQTGVARAMLGNNDSKWKLAEFFFPGTGGPGLAPGYNYLLLFTNLATQETKTYSWYFSPSANVDHQLVDQVISDPTSPVTPTDPVVPTPGNPYDYTYSIVETGVDSEGTAFTKETAPVYAEVIPDHPKAVENQYVFPQQVAKGVANFKRFPPFTVTRVRTHLWGPYYSVASANLHFTRGITALNAWANFRSGPTNLAALPAERKIFMYDDANCRAYAQVLLNENGSSANAGVWSAFGNGRQYSDPANPNTEPAFRAIGARIWQGDKTSLDTAGRGVKYVSFDLESTDNFQFERFCIGWMYQGYLTAANADGLFPVVVLYGQFQFMANVYSGSLKQLATGYPEYLNAGTSFDLFAGIDPTIQAVIQSGGSLTVDGYMQGIHGYEDILVRDSSHNPVLSNGAIQYTAAASTVLYGQTVPLQGATPAINDNPAFPSEAARLVSDLRRHAARLYIQWHWMAGGYPETSDQRRAGYETAHVGAAIRLDNEGVLGMIYNDRPLPQWQLEVVTQLNSWHAIDGDNINWASCFNVPPTTPGNHPATANNYPYDAGGPVEAVEKGLHRFSQFNSVRVGNCRFGWPNLDIVSSNLIDGERPEQKPIIKLEFWGTGDNQTMIVIIVWEMLDGTSKDFIIWFEQDGGYKSLSYTATVTNGREGYCLAAFKLPAGRPNFLGKHARIQFTDILGVKRTITGDYRVQVSGNPVPPAAFVPGTTTPTTPTTPVFSVSGTYNRNTHKLNMAGASAVGGITYNIVGITEGFAVQPSGGFDVPASLRDGTQTLTIAAKTATQQAQTTIAIPADQVASGPSTAPRMPEMFASVFPGPAYVNVFDRNYSGPVDRGGNEPISPDILGDFHNVATANGTRNVAWGASFFAFWAQYNPGRAVGDQPSYTWTEGNINAGWKEQFHNFNNRMAALGGIVGVGLGMYRNSYFQPGFFDESQVGHDANGNPLNHGADQILQPEFFADFFNNKTDTSNPAYKAVMDARYVVREAKTHIDAGTITHFMGGTRAGLESGLDSDLGGQFLVANYTEKARSYMVAFFKQQSWATANNATTDAQKLANANARWGTSYGSWDQVTIPFNASDGLNTFTQTRYNGDVKGYQVYSVGLYLAAQAYAVWVEQPNMPFVIIIGQILGNLGVFCASHDLVTWIRQLVAVRTGLGLATTINHIGIKIDSDIFESKYVNNRHIEYALRQELGEGQPIILDEIDFSQYNYPNVNRTIRGADMNSVAAHYVESQRYASGKLAISLGQIGPNFTARPDTGYGGRAGWEHFWDDILAVASTYYNTANRLTPIITGFGTAGAPTINISPYEQQANITSYQGVILNRLNALDGPAHDQDVKIIVGSYDVVPYSPPTTQPTACVPVAGGTLGQDVTVTQNSEFVFSIDGLTGDTGTMQFVWVATNGAVIVQGGNTFATRFRFPNVGESVVTCQVTNACGSVTRTVKVTVPAPPDSSLVQPYFDVSVDQPVLQGNGTYSQAVIHLTGLKNATRYKIFVGDVTDNSQDFFTDVTGTSASFTEPAPASGVSKKYSVRFWNGTDTAHWADRSFTITSPATAPTQYIVAIQTKRTPGQVNFNGVQLRVQTAGGYVPKFAFSKTGFPVLSNTSGDVPAFQQGSYQYGTIISDLPNTGSEYITVGFLDSSGRVAQILISDKAGTDTDWVTQYPLSS